MRTSYRKVMIFLMLAAIAGGLAACGDSSNDAKLLPRSSASDLRSTLAQVQQKVSNGDCNGAQDQVSLLEQQIDSLDSSVDADLRAALVSGASRLQRLVASECAAATTETGTTGATGPTGATDTGGTTVPEEQPDELTKDEKKAEKEREKARKELEKQQKKQDQQGNQDSTGGSGGGDTGSGGVLP
jgi:hypothetical protein